MQETEEYINSSETDVKIRKGKKSDCKEVHRLIKELAKFHKMANGPEIDFKTLENDGFVLNPPLFHLFVAEKPEAKGKKTSELIAYAMYYNKYSPWKGKSMVLEDLYCTEKYRNQNVGTVLFKAVVKEAVSTGCRQMDFEVLEWNPARTFYEKFGATDITQKESWHLYRMTRKDLEAIK